MYKVTRSGSIYLLLNEKGRSTGQVYWTEADAEAARLELTRKAQQKIRICMSCQKPFESEGSHNRMCLLCKRRR